MKRYTVIGAMALIIVLTACGAFTACGTNDTAVSGQGVTEQTAEASDITQAETVASDAAETSAAHIPVIIIAVITPANNLFRNNQKCLLTYSDMSKTKVTISTVLQ